MTVRLPLIALAMCVGAAAQAQEESPQARADRRTSVYVELLGNAGLGSLNVEHRVGTRVALRAGVGYMPGIPATTVSATSVPLMVSFVPLRGRGIELGIGGVLRRAAASAQRNRRPADRRTEFVDPFVTATLGYRWVTDRGVAYRVGVTPIVGRPEGNAELWSVVPLVGVSVGVAL